MQSLIFDFLRAIKKSWTMRHSMPLSCYLFIYFNHKRKICSKINLLQFSSICLQIAADGKEFLCSSGLKNKLNFSQNSAVQQVCFRAFCFLCDSSDRVFLWDVSQSITVRCRISRSRLLCLQLYLRPRCRFRILEIRPRSYVDSSFTKYCQIKKITAIEN